MTKNERGLGLIEALIALALLSILTAYFGIAMQSVLQSRNEANVSSALLAIQQAEATYYSTYNNGYATGANITDLSTCPTAGQPQTKTAACLLPPAYTKSLPLFGYDVSVSTPSDAPSCSVSPCGFLAVANPIAPISGRLAYCATTAGTLNGEVTKTPVSLTTNAGCSTLPVRAAGTTPVTVTVPLYSTTGSGSSISSSGQTIMSLTGLPAGTYQGWLRVTAQFPSSASLTNEGVNCQLAPTASPTNNALSEIPSSSSDPTYVTVALSGPVTISAGGTISAFCWNWGISNAMEDWQGTLSAIPVTNAGN